MQRMRTKRMTATTMRMTEDTTIMPAARESATRMV